MRPNYADALPVIEMTDVQERNIVNRIKTASRKVGLPANCERCRHRVLGKRECTILIALRANCFVIAQEQAKLERGIDKINEPG